LVATPALKNFNHQQQPGWNDVLSMAVTGPDGVTTGEKRMRSGIFGTAILVLTASAAWGQSELDPAPPQVNRLASQAASRPVKHSQVRFFSEPKPLAKDAQTHDWKWFMGPTHDGHSTETRLLKKFPDGGLHKVWELSRGNGYASPSIQGEYLVYPHRVRNEVVIECLHPQTGELYWQFKYATDYSDRLGYSNGPRASPVIDGDRVYTLGAKGELHCLELKTGRVIWERNINRDFGVRQDFFGTVASPLLHGQKLIINLGASGGPSVIALNKVNGRLVWKSGKRWGPSYASPVPGVIHGKPRVFIFAGGESDPPTGGLISLNPDTGKIDFEFPWRSRKYESVNASCPTIVGNSVFISATYKTGSALLKLNPDFTFDTAWTMVDREHNTDEDQLGLHWNTPIYKDGYLYAFDGRNEPDASIVCVDTRVGKVVWRETPEWEEEIVFNGEKQKITVSTLRGNLIAVDGHFLAVCELGHLLWLDLTPQGYRQIDRTWMFGARETWAPPVVSQGLLYVTQNTRDILTGTGPRLICYDLRAGN